MDNFWQAVANHNWVQEEVRHEFRLYYDDQGRVIHYSMEDLPGDYIIVDRLTFDQARFDIRVKDGQIVKLKHPASWKLVPSEFGQHPCHQDDITIVVSSDYHQKKYWEVKTTHEAD